MEQMSGVKTSGADLLRILEAEQDYFLTVHRTFLKFWLRLRRFLMFNLGGRRYFLKCTTSLTRFFNFRGRCIL